MDITSGDQMEYSGQSFKRLDCQGEAITAKEFYDCTFQDCTFVESVFSRCRFVDCRFVACDLSLARVPGSTFRETAFERSKSIGINWTEAVWGIKGGFLTTLHFVACTLNYATLIGVSLPGMVMRACVAKEVDFTDGDFSGADFRRTDFTGSRFLHTNLTRADFRGARGYAIAPALNTITRAQFSLPDAMALLAGLDIMLADDTEPENPTI